MTQTQRHSIFIVDDDPDDRASIHDAFIANKHDHEYVFMKNGEQLMGHFSEDAPTPHPSLILLDLNMPGRDGRDVLKEIKANESLKLIPIIVLTTSSSTKDREVSYRLGANCFVTKPDSYKDLLTLTDSIARLWLYNY
jgi:CheY-like chemotaxis protein